MRVFKELGEIHHNLSEFVHAQTESIQRGKLIPFIKAQSMPKLDRSDIDFRLQHLYNVYTMIHTAYRPMPHLPLRNFTTRLVNFSSKETLLAN